ncbi:MAG: phage major tail tube protein, partial [Eikenella corrodens]|nr:phage major tail tube protein [Eikenella corrodens]
MKMPRILKGFNLYIDGENQYGVIVDVTRPKIARKTDCCG